MNDIKEKIKNIEKEQIIIFIVGLAIGLLTMIIFYPDRIAELKNGEQVAIKFKDANLTADKLYTDLKEKYAINSMLELIDKTILEPKYELNDEDLKSIEESAKSYISYYESAYGMTEEQFLERNGFETFEEFATYLQLDYRRNKYYTEYQTNKITDDEVNSFYNDKVYGTIYTKHILVEVTNTMKDEDAKAKAEEILNKLKNGTSWDDLKNEYSSIIKAEEVPVEFDSNLESAYKTEAENLKNESYSSSLVKTAYGYHIVYRIKNDEKAELKTLETRIKNSIIKEKEKEDNNIYEKTMIKMREEAKMEIKDTELKKAYEKYSKDYK